MAWKKEGAGLVMMREGEGESLQELKKGDKFSGNVVLQWTVNTAEVTV